MATKLRFTLKPVPWFLVGKAILFGGSWLALPFWLFLVLSLYFYFVPPFRIGHFALPYGVLLMLAALFPSGVFPALFLSLIFFLILGIKDLILIGRQEAYEALFFLLLFLVLFAFFARAQGSAAFFPVLSSLAAALVLSLCYKGFLEYCTPSPTSFQKTLFVGIWGFLLWQIVFVLFILPLTVWAKTGIAFLLGALEMEIFLHYLRREPLGRTVARYSLFALFALLVILGGTEWHP